MDIKRALGIVFLSGVKAPKVGDCKPKLPGTPVPEQGHNGYQVSTTYPTKTFTTVKELIAFHGMREFARLNKFYIRQEDMDDAIHLTKLTIAKLDDDGDLQFKDVSCRDCNGDACAHCRLDHLDDHTCALPDFFSFVTLDLVYSFVYTFGVNNNATVEHHNMPTGQYRVHNGILFWEKNEIHRVTTGAKSLEHKFLWVTRPQLNEEVMEEVD